LQITRSRKNQEINKLKDSVQLKISLFKSKDDLITTIKHDLKNDRSILDRDRKGNKMLESENLILKRLEKVDTIKLKHNNMMELEKFKRE